MTLDRTFERTLLLGCVCLCLGLMLRSPAAADDDASAPSATPHPIDALLGEYFQEHGVAQEQVSDRLFIRRVSLDLVGLLPTPEEVDAFVADASPDKRRKLVDRLLSDREAYASHWLTFWSDALRNAYRGAGFIDNGREQITGWLFAALYDNAPYDRFVHELISPVEGSAGFTRGIKWRGVVNESQRPEIQAAQNVAQVFLGTNLKCASCHDSFVNDWTLKEAYKLSAVFADQPLEIHHCDKPTGEISEVGFIYPEIGDIDAAAPRDARMQQLADLVVHRENERFARTIVNRLWAQLMGRGIIEPRDNMDGEPFHPELLDFLARDFVEHGCDLKRTLRLIATSRAYALSAMDGGPDVLKDDFVLRGPLIRRVTAEQFVDAAARVTGIDLEPDGNAFVPDGRNQGGQLAAIGKTLARDAAPSEVVPSLDAAKQLLTSAKWIWLNDQFRQAPGGRQAFFRAEFEFTDTTARIVALISADNEWELFVNGRRSGQSDNWKRPGWIELNEHLTPGRNVVAMRVRNSGSEPNPAGLLAAVGQLAADGTATALTVSSDEWQVSPKAAAGWEQSGFDATSWKRAAAIGDADAAPRELLGSLTLPALDPYADPAAVWRDRTLRAAHLNRDPLQAALGRPNREQTVTGRESQATLLQALELTNGKSLNAILQTAAERMVGESTSSDALARELFQIALGRDPTGDEIQLAQEIVGSPASPAGVSDYLWTLLNLPEFQLIY